MKIGDLVESRPARTNVALRNRHELGEAALPPKTSRPPDDVAPGAIPAAQIARAAMIDLARRRLAPTPENYARAWALASGGLQVDVLPSEDLAQSPGERTQPVDGRARASDDAAEPGSPANHDHAELPGVRRHARLAGELVELVKAMCDTATVLADDDSWVKGQVESLRELLAGEIDHVSLAEFRALLVRTADTQRGIAEGRRAALRALKQTIADLASAMGGLLDSTDQFGQRISAHATRIGDAASIASLSVEVEQLLADTREMKTSVAASRESLSRSHDAATILGNEVARLEDELAAASTEMVTDHLTQTMNRRGLERAFERAMATTKISGRALSVSLIDVDNFKKLNDSLGHQAGDDALKHLATVVKDKLRPTDAVARYGGEEFVILLVGTDLEQAQSTMVRVQRELSAHVFMHGDERHFITFSAGVTQVAEGDSLSSAVGRADDAMYRAKREGKNCVRTA